MAARRCICSATLAFAALLACVPTAAADTRYAGPSGMGADPCADSINPCSLEDAVGGDTVMPDDEVVLLPGTYTLPSGLFFQDIAVGGQPGQPRPVLMAGSGVTVENGGSGSAPPVLRDVEIVHSGGATGLFNDGGIVERAVVTSTGSAACGVTGRSGVDGLIRDTICRNTAGGAAVGVSLTAPGVDNVGRLRNVTAVALAPGGIGILLSATDAIDLEIEAVNVIARGATDDVIATDDGDGGSSTVTLARSNYSTGDVIGPSTVTDPSTSGNQTASPLFVNALGGDLHQQAASPTVNAGTTDALLGERDLDNGPRIQQGTPDIGADEFIPLPPANPAPPSSPAPKKCKKKPKKKGKAWIVAKKKKGCKKRKRGKRK
jgi:hypothetical protein